jgi:hypothetical protein
MIMQHPTKKGQIVCHNHGSLEIDLNKSFIFLSLIKGGRISDWSLTYKNC